MPSSRTPQGAARDPSPTTIPLTLKVPAVAEALSQSERSIWRLIAAGELETVRFGRSIRVTRESVLALIARGGTRQ